MREIKTERITEAVKRLCTEANHFLGDDVKGCIHRGLLAETDDLTVTAQKTIVLSAEGKISIGKENYEPGVLGNKLKDLLGRVLDKIMALTVPTAVGPSGVPVNSADFASIKTELDNLLSQKVEIE